VFQRRLEQAAAAAWQLSSSADYRFRTTEGPPQGRLARLTGGYVGEVMRAATRRPWLRQRLTEVLHLIRPPWELFSPGVLARLAWDWLAAHSAAGVRLVTRLGEETQDAARSPRRTVAELDVMSPESSRG
jgi:hypothetical protein